jgi:hypothetical protein
VIALEEIMAQLTPEEIARVKARTDELHQEYLALQKLREELNLPKDEENEQQVSIVSTGETIPNSGNHHLTLKALSEAVTNLGGEWEINVRLPGAGMIRLTGSEEFPVISS